MTEPRRPVAAGSLRATDRALDDLLAAARVAAPHQLADLIERCAQKMGARRSVVYLADLQELVLVPFVGRGGPGEGAQLTPLDVDSTLAGRSFQTFELHLQDAGNGETHVWLPLLVGGNRLGVLGVTLGDGASSDTTGGPKAAQFMPLAVLAASLISAQTPYGDTLTRLRRRTEMGLAAEIQWSLLPPLTFVSTPVTVAAALEPAYHVGGDTIDYAVDAGVARVAIFDVMGHGLHSAQTAVLAVAAYRNARRAGRTLGDTMEGIDAALLAGLGGDMFTTAVLAQLDTDTGALQWVNAGHPEPMLLRGGKFIKTLHAEPHPPLGLGYLRKTRHDGIGYEQLQPGDRVLLYTDGVVEARSPTGEFFGVERLADLVLRHLAGGLPDPETMRRVVRELLDHHQDQLSDDASLLLLEWRRGGS